MDPAKIWEYSYHEREGRSNTGRAIAGVAKMLAKVQKIDRTWLSGTTSFILGGVPFLVLPQQ